MMIMSFGCDCLVTRASQNEYSARVVAKPGGSVLERLSNLQNSDTCTLFPDLLDALLSPQIRQCIRVWYTSLFRKQKSALSALNTVGRFRAGIIANLIIPHDHWIPPFPVCYIRMGFHLVTDQGSEFFRLLMNKFPNVSRVDVTEWNSSKNVKASTTPFLQLK